MNLKSVLIFGPGVQINGSALLDGMSSVIGTDVPITGGLAGDGGAFRQTFTLGGEGVTRISVIPLWLMAFGIVFSFFFGVCSGYYPANRAVRIPALEAIKSE